MEAGGKLGKRARGRGGAPFVPAPDPVDPGLGPGAEALLLARLDAIERRIEGLPAIIREALEGRGPGPASGEVASLRADLESTRRDAERSRRQLLEAEGELRRRSAAIESLEEENERLRIECKELNAAFAEGLRLGSASAPPPTPPPPPPAPRRARAANWSEVPPRPVLRIDLRNSGAPGPLPGPPAPGAAEPDPDVAPPTSTPTDRG